MFARHDKRAGHAARAKPQFQIEELEGNEPGDGERGYLNSLLAMVPKFPEAMSRFSLTCMAISFYLFANLMLVGRTADPDSGVSSFFQVITATPAVHVAALSAFFVVLLHIGDLAGTLRNSLANALHEAGRLALSRCPKAFQNEFYGAAFGEPRSEVWKNHPSLADQVRAQVHTDVFQAYAAVKNSPGILNPYFHIFLRNRWAVLTRSALGSLRAMLIIATFATGIGIILGHLGAVGCRAGLSGAFWAARGSERAAAQCLFKVLDQPALVKEGGARPATPKSRPEGSQSPHRLNVIVIRVNMVLGLIVLLLGGYSAWRIANDLTRFIGQYKKVNSPDDTVRVASIILPCDPRYKLKYRYFNVQHDEFVWLRIFYPLLYGLLVLASGYLAYQSTVYADGLFYGVGADWIGAARNSLSAILRFIDHIF